MVHDPRLRPIYSRCVGGRPNALRSTPRAGRGGLLRRARRNKDSKAHVHVAVNTLRRLLALHVTPAGRAEPHQVEGWTGQCGRWKVRACSFAVFGSVLRRGTLGGDGESGIRPKVVKDIARPRKVLRCCPTDGWREASRRRPSPSTGPPVQEHERLPETGVRLRLPSPKFFSVSAEQSRPSDLRLGSSP